MTKFPGFEWKCGDGTFIVPALSLAQLKNGMLEKMQQHDRMLRTEGDEWTQYTTLPLRAEIIHAALSRNYPDMDLEAVERNLDLSNVRTVWMAVLGLSGFTPREVVPGEQTAAETPST